MNPAPSFYNQYKALKSMATIQTHAAPDLLTLDESEDETTKAKTVVARVGTRAVPVRKGGYRENDGFDQIMISLADLKALQKESYKLGWEGKCIHVRTLLDQIPREIGT